MHLLVHPLAYRLVHQPEAPIGMVPPPGTMPVGMCVADAAASTLATGAGVVRRSTTPRSSFFLTG
ncbi:MAG: hypothetical protein ABF976_11295 [Acetobacter syzygii]